MIFSFTIQSIALLLYEPPKTSPDVMHLRGEVTFLIYTTIHTVLLQLRHTSVITLNLERSNFLKPWPGSSMPYLERAPLRECNQSMAMDAIEARHGSRKLLLSRLRSENIGQMFGVAPESHLRSDGCSSCSFRTSSEGVLQWSTKRFRILTSVSSKFLVNAESKSSVSGS